MPCTAPRVSGLSPCFASCMIASATIRSSPLHSLLLQVLIFGHSPPGKFERDYSSTGHHWLDHASNRRFVHFVRTFSDVIVGQFFGHQHTDSFRLFKDVGGERASERSKMGGRTGKATLHKTASTVDIKWRRKEGVVLMENSYRPCRRRRFPR